MPMERLFGVFRFDEPTLTYGWAWVAVLPRAVVIHVPKAGDYRFPTGSATVQSVRRGFWLAWYQTDGSTKRLQIIAPGRRRELAAALESAEWSVQR